MLYSLDIFFLVFHSLFTLFNIFGWMWKKTRILHLITLGATLFSWVVLGFWYGFGFCFCTQWHWQILARLGRYPQERGYIEFLVNRITGLQLPHHWVEKWTLVVMIVIVIAALWINIRDYRNKKKG